MRKKFPHRENIPERNKDMSKWKGSIPYSWIGWLNMIMVSVPHKLIYKFSAVSLKRSANYAMAYTTWFEHSYGKTNMQGELGIFLKIERQGIWWENGKRHEKFKLKLHISFLVKTKNMTTHPIGEVVGKQTVLCIAGGNANCYNPFGGILGNT